MTVHFVQAIMSLRPGVEFVLHGEDVSEIKWLEDGVEPLTNEEVDAEWTRLKQAEADKAAADEDAKVAAIEHAKSLGFTDEMIAVMYPNLGVRL